MTISVVLRIAQPALAMGRLAGQVEIVEDGSTAVIRDAEELVALLRRHLDAPAQDARGRLRAVPLPHPLESARGIKPGR